MIGTEPARQAERGVGASVTPTVTETYHRPAAEIVEVYRSSPPTKVRPYHQDRLAVVYVRQSTPQQVLEHQESTALQYNLRRRAMDWGWPAERVLIIDEDQGHSGASAADRLGFQRLLVEVGLDHVGLVLGIEMSRLARSCRDWHQLLEVCALFGVLLADTDGLYDPREYNDRLLLGLKGTLSEAELHILRQRMYQGRLNKARRGELFNHPPMGYVRLPTGELAMDPDQQVQAVIRLIFEQFDRRGTINAVLRHLVTHGIQLPVRPYAGPDRGQLQWHRPSRQTLRCLLHHPLYAGAYTWGRRAVDPRRKIPGRPSTGRTVVAAEQCMVFLRDRCPAYITWPQYQGNLRRLADNRNRGQHPGPVREGSALLKGLLVCGRCGGRMMVQYDRPATAQPADLTRPRYVCCRDAATYGGPLCQSLAGSSLDALVARQVLTVLEPAAVELSLAAAEDIQRQRATLDQHWAQRLERTNYQADRAARQYHAVEPENRLVARELEARWEQALADHRQLQDQYDRFRNEQPAALADADRQAVRNLAADIPGLWHSPATSSADRQTILRHLVEQVTVTVAPDGSQHADVTIRWAGGFTSQYVLTRSVARYEQLDNYKLLLARILELRNQRKTAAQIAEQLNREGFHPPKRRATFNVGIIRQLLSRQGRFGRRPKAVEGYALGPDEWWFTDLARHLQLPNPTLYSWLRRGWVQARQLPVAKGRWILWADADELDRLRRLHRCPRSWWNQPHAADLTQPRPRLTT
jgi:DNA invertase Pin-like site-specific DNA recombinase